MAETAFTPVTAPGKWSATGQALSMVAVDNANGNKFTSSSDQLLVAQNTSGGALTFQITSQPISGTGAGAGRTGSVSQSLAAGEIRVFRLTGNGWADSNGNILMPTGMNTALKVAIVNLQ